MQKAIDLIVALRAMGLYAWVETGYHQQVVFVSVHNDVHTSVLYTAIDY